MENITEELKSRRAVICMRCGGIFTGKDSIFEDDNCPTCGEGKGWFNWVTGNMHHTFWGTPAARQIASEFDTADVEGRQN